MTLYSYITIFGRLYLCHSFEVLEEYRLDRKQAAAIMREWGIKHASREMRRVDAGFNGSFYRLGA